jgi:hypothetical protein
MEYRAFGRLVFECNVRVPTFGDNRKLRTAFEGYDLFKAFRLAIGKENIEVKVAEAAAQINMLLRPNLLITKEQDFVFEPDSLERCERFIGNLAEIQADDFGA